MRVDFIWAEVDNTYPGLKKQVFNPNRFSTGPIILCFYICNKSLITDRKDILSVINDFDLLLYIQIHYSYIIIHYTFSVL